MISIEEAKGIIAEHLPPRKTEKVDLAEAMGRVLAEDIAAPEPSPRYTNSAMDGFAVRWEDVQNVEDTNPVTLPIAAESRAGVPFLKPLPKGQAVRISTGAMLPDGADTVIPQEDTRSKEKTVEVLNVNRKNQNIRFKGEEFDRGSTVLHEGEEINSARMGLLASLGIQNVSVFRKPKAALIVTGTEIQPFDAPVKPWQIRDSNSIMLQSAIQAAGGEAVLTKMVGDSLRETRSALDEALTIADIIIFSGGVSVGPHDLVKETAQKNGFETLFWKVNQKPGKPLFAARKENTLLFGLPGNPVSAYMCYLLYVQPVIAYFQGRETDKRIIKARSKEALQNNLSRDHLLRVKIVGKQQGVLLISPVSKQGSHMLTSLTEADGFVLLRKNQTIPAGEIVEVFLF